MDYILFIFERLDWLGVVDILMVTIVFYVILRTLQDTQAMVLLRGGLVLIALLGLLTSLDIFPAFSWLVGNAFPALLLAIPVIFAPEIRRALERLGRTGNLVSTRNEDENGDIVDDLVSAVVRLSDRKHGALIVLQRLDNLQEYVQTGVLLRALETPELILQIFYPNTPLHDGAIILDGETILAASCVMPLSTSGSLITTPERKMGLRHRAALGTSEESDGIAIVVSEETGVISIAYSGRMIGNLSVDRLQRILRTFYKPEKSKNPLGAFLQNIFPWLSSQDLEERL